MRSAVVVSAILAALAASGAALSPFTSKFSARTMKSTRELQSSPCLTAMTTASGCVAGYSNGADNEMEVINTYCCGNVDTLYNSCGGSIGTAMQTLLSLGDASTLSGVTLIFGSTYLLGNCQRTNASEAACQQAVNDANGCLSLYSDASREGSCCSEIGDQLEPCIGTGGPGSGSNTSHFIDNLGGLMNATGCAVFPLSMCQTAAAKLKQCAQSATAAVSAFSLKKCCQLAQFYDMFCFNHDQSDYSGYGPDASLLTAIENTCHDDHNGDGSDGSDNGGSNNGGGPGTNNNDQCDPSRIAQGFQWYTGSGGMPMAGTLVTNNPAYAQNMMPPAYTDVYGVMWWYVNYMAVPNAYKLSPREWSCNWNNMGGGMPMP